MVDATVGPEFSWGVQTLRDDDGIVRLVPGIPEDPYVVVVLPRDGRGWHVFGPYTASQAHDKARGEFGWTVVLPLEQQ